jgi:hypothetical protein
VQAFCVNETLITMVMNGDAEPADRPYACRLMSRREVAVDDSRIAYSPALSDELCTSSARFLRSKANTSVPRNQNGTCLGSRPPAGLLDVHSLHEGIAEELHRLCMPGVIFLILLAKAMRTLHPLVFTIYNLTDE